MSFLNSPKQGGGSIFSYENGRACTLIFNPTLFSVTFLSQCVSVRVLFIVTILSVFFVSQGLIIVEYNLQVYASNFENQAFWAYVK